MPKKGGKKGGKKKAPSYLTDAESLEPFGVSVGHPRSLCAFLLQPVKQPQPMPCPEVAAPPIFNGERGLRAQDQGDPKGP